MDIVAEKEGIKYCVEVKSSYVTEIAIRQVCLVAEKINMTPILVAVCCIDE